MGLLDGVDWLGKVFKGGAWTDGGGGTYAVVEPATGGELGTMGQADADDVAEAAGSAAEAQRDWAALPHTARAAVLRKAGDLWAEMLRKRRSLKRPIEKLARMAKGSG